MCVVTVTRYTWCQAHWIALSIPFSNCPKGGCDKAFGVFYDEPAFCSKCLLEFDLSKIRRDHYSLIPNVANFDDEARAQAKDLIQNFAHRYSKDTPTEGILAYRDELRKIRNEVQAVSYKLSQAFRKGVWLLECYFWENFHKTGIPDPSLKELLAELHEKLFFMRVWRSREMTIIEYPSEYYYRHKWTPFELMDVEAGTECIICTNELDARNAEGRLESAVTLDCGNGHKHAIGYLCILAWLNEGRKDGSYTCPIDRQPILKNYHGRGAFSNLIKPLFLNKVCALPTPDWLNTLFNGFDPTTIEDPDSIFSKEAPASKRMVEWRTSIGGDRELWSVDGSKELCLQVLD